MRWCLLLLILFIPVNAQNSTVYGPGEGYKITFLHSGYLDNKNTTFNFEKLPITEILVENFTNQGLDYGYLGYANLTKFAKLRMHIDDKKFYSNDTLEYMDGGFPFVFPIQYNNHKNWLAFFVQQIRETKFNQWDEYLLFASTPTTDQTYTHFRNAMNASYLNNTLDFIKPFQFLPEGLTDSLFNVTVTLHFQYTSNTGVLYGYNYTLAGMTNHSKVRQSESLDFVAIIPPFNAFFKLNYTGTLLIFILPIFRKRTRQ